VETEISHVTSRGNDRDVIFRDELDYLTFLRILAARREWLCHAFCLMPNHYHLLVEASPVSLSRGMHRLNGAFARRFNVRRERSGHLFEGPYRPEPVARDAHFLEASRYIVLNPVRAGLCAEPAAWPWSSYRQHAGIDARWGFLAEVHGLFGDTEGFRRFVAGGA